MTKSKKISVISGEKYFDNLLGDIKPIEDDLFSFFVRVGVIKYRPPRHPFFEFILNVGMSDVVNVLKQNSFSGKDILSFVFPERWMSVHERYRFMSDLCKHPEVSKIKQVDILTSDPVLVGNFLKEQIRIITFDDKNYSHDNKD